MASAAARRRPGAMRTSLLCGQLRQVGVDGFQNVVREHVRGKLLHGLCFESYQAAAQCGSERSRAGCFAGNGSQLAATQRDIQRHQVGNL